MNRIAIAIITAALVLGCVTGPASSEPVVGFTIVGTPACEVADLSPESTDLVTKWWILNHKGNAGTLTPGEQAEGDLLFQSGRCGLLLDNIPVWIVLLDGTILLAMMPDGSTLGLPSEGFKRNTDGP